LQAFVDGHPQRATEGDRASRAGSTAHLNAVLRYTISARTTPMLQCWLLLLLVQGQHVRAHTPHTPHRRLSTYFTVDGPCTVNGTCVRSPNYPSEYTGGQSCTITPTNLAVGQLLSATAFNTENGYDKLIVNGVTYSGTTGQRLHVVLGRLFSPLRVGSLRGGSTSTTAAISAVAAILATDVTWLPPDRRELLHDRERLLRWRPHLVDERVRCRRHGA
jgi:hypothetical protein